MTDKTEKFLERATAGLATDPELRLDVQAELRAHIEDKTAELGGGEHADEAVASLGEVVELAEEVAQANQRRLGWRNLARRVLRFGLVPASILCAIRFADISGILMNEQIREMMTGGVILGPADGKVTPRVMPKENPLNILRWFKFLRQTRPSPFDANYSTLPQSAMMRWLERSPSLTEHQRLLLDGDTTQEPKQRYRVLWDSDPTNRAYLADYLSHYGLPGGRDHLPVLEEAYAADPDNARYALAIAMAKVNQAAMLGTEPPSPTGVYALQINDRQALDQAMGELLQATAMPEYRRYCLEMVRERLTALGPPESMAEVSRRSILAASILLPDLQTIRSAARHSLSYAQLLIDEGHPQEAGPYLLVPEKLSAMLLPDSFCLIDLLVARAITNMAHQAVPDLLRQTRHETEAAAAENRLNAITEPMRQYRERCNLDRQEFDRILNQRSGTVSGLLLNALAGQDITDLDQELSASRHLEFTVITEGTTSLLAALMLVAMLLCLVVSLRWRWSLGSQAAPLLLLPSWRDLLRGILVGVVLPFAIFLAWTLWSPWSGQAYSLKYAGHRTAAELVLLAAALLIIPTWLALRAFQRRCAELEIAQPLRLPRLLSWLFLLVALVPLVGAMVPPGSRERVELGGAIVGVGTILLVALLGMALLLALFVPRAYGRAIGTLSRSLIPVFALAVLMLSLVVQPILHAQERRLLHADTLVWDTDGLGFVPFETRLITQLRASMLKAMAENPMP